MYQSWTGSGSFSFRSPLTIIISSYTVVGSGLTNDPFCASEVRPGDPRKSSLWRV